MAFASTVKSEPVEDNKKSWRFRTSLLFRGGIRTKVDIQEAYDQLFEKNLKLKMLSRSTFKKLHDLELENERLVVKLGELTSCVNGLKIRKEFLENEVKILGSKLKISNVELCSFSSGSKMFDNIWGLNELAWSKGGLGFNDTSYHTATSSKNTFVPIFIMTQNLGVTEPTKKMDFLGQRSSVQHTVIQPRVLNLKPRVAPGFIPTYHKCCKLGHTRPRCHKLLIRNNKQNITTPVRFLTNQASHLTEMMTYWTKITSSSKNLWVKISELIG